MLLAPVTDADVEDLFQLVASAFLQICEWSTPPHRLREGSLSGLFSGHGNSRRARLSQEGSPNQRDKATLQGVPSMCFLRQTLV